MATLLAKKAGVETPLALDDDRHAALAADPSVSQFPASSTFGATNAFTSTPSGATATSTAPATGFGASSSFGSSATTPAAITTNATAAVAPNPAMLASTGGAMQEGADVLVKNTNEDWINKKWRPVMGWVYMLTCTCDFVLFPVLWSLLQALSKGSVTSQWQPLTLQGAGLYHIAMGAVLGIAAYGRTKEKLDSKQ